MLIVFHSVDCYYILLYKTNHSDDNYILYNFKNLMSEVNMVIKVNIVFIGTFK